MDVDQTGDVTVIGDFRSHRAAGSANRAGDDLGGFMNPPDVPAAGPLPGVAEIVERRSFAAGRSTDRES